MTIEENYPGLYQLLMWLHPDLMEERSLEEQVVRFAREAPVSSNRAILEIQTILAENRRVSWREACAIAYLKFDDESKQVEWLRMMLGLLRQSKP